MAFPLLAPRPLQLCQDPDIGAGRPLGSTAAGPALDGGRATAAKQTLAFKFPGSSSWVPLGAPGKVQKLPDHQEFRALPRIETGNLKILGGDFFKQQRLLTSSAVKDPEPKSKLLQRGDDTHGAAQSLIVASSFNDLHRRPGQEK